MSNHVHLFLQTLEPNLSRAVQICEGISDDVAGNIFQQVCLGGREFLQGLLEKNGQGDLALARSRPTAAEVKAAVARVRGQRPLPVATAIGGGTWP